MAEEEKVAEETVEEEQMDEQQGEEKQIRRHLEIDDAFDGRSRKFMVIARKTVEQKQYRNIVNGKQDGNTV